jgi:nitrate/TMAO reductase-like tetraheme cytochrome c subunit
VATGAVDAQGHPVSAACSTCHTTKSSNPELKVGMEMKTFHQGLKGRHGDLTCISCHNASEGYQSLRLADGRALPFPDVMQLCAQCHGPQYRDYQNGAHGGMLGHWDLATGGRVRANCIDCHDPHTPKYPLVRPAPGPRDRFQHPAHSKPGVGHE